MSTSPTVSAGRAQTSKMSVFAVERVPIIGKNVTRCPRLARKSRVATDATTVRGRDRHFLRRPDPTETP